MQKEKKLGVSRSDMTPLEPNRGSLQKLLDAAPDAMVVVDAAGRIVIVNACTEELFGYGAGELIDATVEILVPGARREAHADHRDRYQQVPRRRPMGSGLELWGRRKDGSLFPVEISLSPMQGREGPLVIAAVRDNTIKAAVEGALKAANKELEAFTYSVSHDLRAPIRQIDGFARLLDERCRASLDEKGRHYLSRIQEGAQSMGRLVDDLLSLARIGQQGLRPERVSLDDLVRAARSDLEGEAEGRDIEWQLGPLPTIQCDAGLVKIALTNLLSNALKYTRPRARAVIEVSERPSRGTAAVVVRDNGVGFEMKYADKLFGVFQRLHRAEEFEGQGVGLAIVQRIIHKHGGDIWAEAWPDRGAAFYFTLPGLEEALKT